MQSDSDAKQSAPKISEEQLNDIYPTPKTFDELYAEREERQKLFDSRRPKHLSMLVSLSLYSVIISALLIGTVIPDMIGGNPLSGVSLAFLFTLIWIGFSRWVLINITESIHSCGLNVWWFYTLYVLCCLVPLAAVSTFFIQAASSLALVLFFGLTTALHFIVTFTLITLGQRAVKKQAS